MKGECYGHHKIATAVSNINLNSDNSGKHILQRKKLTPCKGIFLLWYILNIIYFSSLSAHYSTHFINRNVLYPVCNRNVPSRLLDDSVGYEAYEG